jgi:TRAP-type C4-dicarboxylate transport system permease small subunit
MLARLERIARGGTRALSMFGLFALMVLAFITLANGLLRWAFHYPIAGVVDVGALAIAIAVSCCIPMSMMERSHIAFRLLSSITPRLGSVLNMLADIAVAVVLGLMAWQFAVYAGELMLTGESTYVLKIPVGPFWYVSGAIIAIAAAVQCVVVALDIGYLLGVAPKPQIPER